jgi:3-oxoacyl-[acyl-carrier-protein] synthase-1
LTNSAYIRSTSVFTPLALGSRANYDAIFSGNSAVQKNEQFNCHASTFENLEAEPGKTRLETILCKSITDAIEPCDVDLSSDTTLILCTTKGDIEDLNAQEALLPDLAQRLADFAGVSSTPIVLSMACTSGTMGLIMGQRLIAQGKAKNVLVVGGDQVSRFVIEGFRSFHALSQGLCAPYDRDRDGINLGEASAVCILSSEKGSSTTAVIGGGTSNDANHISGPSRTGDGLHLAVQRALKNADKSANEIDFISAHGTATSYNDEMESKAFGLSSLNEKPLHSLKGYFGHTLGAAGLLESIMCMQSLDNQSLPASAGYSNEGTSVPLQVIDSPRESKVSTCIKTSSGFGGCNAAVVIEKV